MHNYKDDVGKCNLSKVNLEINNIIIASDFPSSCCMGWLLVLSRDTL